MLRTMVLSLAACVTLGFCSQADAGVIYDNLVSTTYTPASGYTISEASSPAGSDNSRTESFVAGASENLDSILVAMWHAAGNATFSLTLTDSLDNVIESWGGLIAPNTGAPRSVVTATSLSGVLLQSGQTYKLTATAETGTWDAWENLNSLNRGTAGFRVLGADAPAVPEPSTLALAGLGVVGLAAGALRRRKA